MTTPTSHGGERAHCDLCTKHICDNCDTDVQHITSVEEYLKNWRRSWHPREVSHQHMLFYALCSLSVVEWDEYNGL